MVEEGRSGTPHMYVLRITSDLEWKSAGLTSVVFVLLCWVDLHPSEINTPP